MNDYTTHKNALEAGLKELKEELEKIGVNNPDDPSEWKAKSPDMQIMEADRNEAADRSEELQANVSVINELGTRYTNVVRALEKIENGTYGICEIGGEKIEEDRLTANPAARTCKKHMEEEASLEK
jgi:RNA polymerase-binding transcription factor DksA